MNQNVNKNPLLSEFQTPHHVFPFNEIQVPHVEEAISKGIEREVQEIKDIVENQEEPSFENTIVRLEESGRLLGDATTLMYNQLSANATDELEELSQRVASKLSKHHSEIFQNSQLFERVKKVYLNVDKYEGEARMLLTNTYDAFVRSGALLSDADKEKFKNIKSELSLLTLQFSQNHLKATNDFVLHVEDKDQLVGLPEIQLTQAQQLAQERGKEGYAFTLHAPSYIPFLTYVENRALRQKMYVAYMTQCVEGTEFSNVEVVQKIVNLRRELAQLLGFDSYASYVLTHRMAEKPENVYQLLNDLTHYYLPVAKHEVDEIRIIAKRLNNDDFVLMPWDFTFYSQKLKKEKFNIDSEMLRPYFELSKVVDGVFGLASKMYGISFVENPSIPVYADDVSAFEVFDSNGDFLAVLYTDFHPRNSKKSGAWMTNYRETDKNGRPHVSIVMNFTRPTKDCPALLTHDEVETFLHEFGHALHSILSKSTYSSLGGTNVYWDFVELPSQFMENYAVEKDFLNSFARHYKTGELIPEDLIGKIIESRNFQAGYACVRQVSFGVLDMAYYASNGYFAENVRDFEVSTWKELNLLPLVDGACMSVQFEHIMSGGYAAGYYSYKWAEVLDADAFSLFKEEGIFNAELTTRFRKNILERGGTEHPMSLYKAFKGAAPSIYALLKRNGIDKSQVDC